MKAADKRKKIFDLYASNLTNLCETTNLKIGIKNDQEELIELKEPAIFCPLCMSLFTERTLENGFVDRLTIEHIPPESVGGKGKILTCKICNETIGKKLDHHIQKELNTEPFLKAIPNSVVEGRLQINASIPFKAKFTYQKGKFILAPTLDKKTKVHYHKAMNEVQTKWEGTKFKVRFWGGNNKMSKLAIVKSAYLEMFAFFGHIFLFNSNSAKIREQINNPSKDILPHSSIIEHDFDDQVLGINIIKQPLDRICFLVILNLKVNQNNYNKKVGVLIPGPDDHAWATYSNFKNDEQIVAKLTFLSNMNCIREKELTLAFNDIWFDTKNQIL